MAKILLVEDDNNLRDIYGERLMAEGYEIISASDGEEALQMAAQQNPDLIISDVMMPKISGFDMLDILRQTPGTKDIKIIMMTALSQAEDKSRADKLGADKYLVKSQVTLEDVARVVHDLLGDAPAEDTAEDTTASTASATEATTAPATETVLPVATPPSVVEPTTQPSPTPEPAIEPEVEPAAAPVASPVVPVASDAAEPVATTPTDTPVEVPAVNVAEPAAVTPAPEPAATPTFVTPQVPTEAASPVTPPVNNDDLPSEPMPTTMPQTIQPNDNSATLTPPAPTEPAATPITSDAGLPSSGSASTAPAFNPISGADNGTGISNDSSSSDASSTDQEMADVAKQIENFVAQEGQVAEHTEPVKEPTEQDLIHAKNANEDPKVVAAATAPGMQNNVATPDSEQAAAPAKQDPSVPPIIKPALDTANPEPVSNRKKIIQPINDVSTPDIHELYEQQMAQEAASSNVVAAQVAPEEPAEPAEPQQQSVQPDYKEEEVINPNPITTNMDPPEEEAPPELEQIDANTITGIQEPEDDGSFSIPGMLPASEEPTSEPAQAEIAAEQPVVAQSEAIAPTPAEPTASATASVEPTAQPEQEEAKLDPNDPNNFAL